MIYRLKRIDPYWMRTPVLPAVAVVGAVAALALINRNMVWPAIASAAVGGAAVILATQPAVSVLMGTSPARRPGHFRFLAQRAERGMTIQGRFLATLTCMLFYTVLVDGAILIVAVLYNFFASVAGLGGLGLDLEADDGAGRGLAPMRVKRRLRLARAQPRRRLLEALQGAGVSVTVAQRAKEVQGFLRTAAATCFLIGQKLADEDGIEFVKSLRTKDLQAAPDRGPGRARRFPPPTRADQARLRPVRPRRLGGSGRRDRARGREGPGVDAPGVLPGRRRRMPVAELDAAECLARVKAVLRRTQASAPEELIKMGEIELNLTSYTLHISGKRVLTSKELDLLYVFLSSANRVLSRPYLIERVWL